MLRNNYQELLICTKYFVTVVFDTFKEIDPDFLL